MTSKKMTEMDLDAEAIRASVEKHRHWLRFFLFLAGIGATGYVLGEEARSPPTPDPSVECVRATGSWHPDLYDVAGRKIDGFCDQRKDPR